jgi:hypothetical protein
MIIPIYFSNKIEHLFSYPAKKYKQKKKVRFILQPEYIFYDSRYGYDSDD